MYKKLNNLKEKEAIRFYYTYLKNNIKLNIKLNMSVNPIKDLIHDKSQKLIEIKNEIDKLSDINALIQQSSIESIIDNIQKNDTYIRLRLSSCNVML